MIWACRSSLAIPSAVLTRSSKQRLMVRQDTKNVTQLLVLRFQSTRRTCCNNTHRWWPVVSNNLDSSFLTTKRCFSSSGNRNKDNNNKGAFQLDALPFTVAPEEALAEFERWAVDDQGLYYLMRWNSVKIGASYVPVWSFDLNVRFIVTKDDGQKRYDWKPDAFAIPYQNQTVMYIPGLAAYAGYSYRRSLINPIHNTSLVFLGDKTVPFGQWMLRDMRLQNGERLEVFPDPWNATRGRAFAVVREELEALASTAEGKVEVQTEIVSSRRVYMPTFVIDYSILGGAEYRAFVSGCDAGSGVSGVSHKVWNVSNQKLQQASHSFLGKLGSAARMMGGRHMGGTLMILLQLFGNVASRVLARIPLIAAVGSVFVGFRKVIQPWMDNRFASAKWERQRQHEADMDDSQFESHTDDFVDYSGSARRYFQQNRKRILSYLSGEQVHQQGDFEWYKDWEEWARRQYQQQQQQQTYQQQTYQQQQQQQQQAYQRQQQQQRAQRPRPKPKPDFHWDFDPNDPYSVLGVRRGASKSEVSAAFRREMLKYHPDVNGNATEAEKARSLERSKLISEAYRRIKAEQK